MPNYPVGTRVHILGADYDGQEGEVIGETEQSLIMNKNDRYVRLDSGEMIFCRSWSMIKL